MIAPQNLFRQLRTHSNFSKQHTTNGEAGKLAPRVLFNELASRLSISAHEHEGAFSTFPHVWFSFCPTKANRKQRRKKKENENALPTITHRTSTTLYP